MKNDRLQRLLALYDEIATEEKKKMLGMQVEVLVEKKNRDELHLKGRTSCWKKVIFPGDDSLIGTFQQVKIHGYSHQTLLGELVSTENKKAEKISPLSLIS